MAGAIISSHLPAFILKQLFGGFLLLISCNFIVQELKSYHQRTRPIKTE
ncbi:hypothetical protein [Desulfoluna butyratoxydans]|nr:hypothetical protein [Desulfoluna butyratoxydans]